jgi:putative NADPH-quinone reductase
MKNILIINGHPNKESYNYALHQAYKRGLQNKGNCHIEEILVADLQFNLNLSKGYSMGITMENDLLNAQNKIKKADHLVWIYPLWWGMMPALLKGFIHRVFVPGFAFKYHHHDSKWDKLLSGKTTEIICSIDYPVFLFKWFFGEGGVKVMRKMVLEFCGLKVSKTTYVGPIKTSSENQRINWLKMIEKMVNK